MGVVWLCGASCMPAATCVQGRTGRSGWCVCPCCEDTWTRHNVPHKTQFEKLSETSQETL